MIRRAVGLLSEQGLMWTVQYFYFEKYLELHLYLKQIEMELIISSVDCNASHHLYQRWRWSKIKFSFYFPIVHAALIVIGTCVPLTINIWLSLQTAHLTTKVTFIALLIMAFATGATRSVICSSKWDDVRTQSERRLFDAKCHNCKI